MTKNIVIAVLALTMLLFGYVAFFSGGHLLGGTPTGQVHYQGESFIGGLQIGQRGTFITNVLSGTCNLSQSIAGSFSASTTAQFYCAVPGAQSGDLVLADLPVGAGTNANGGGSPFGGFLVVSAYATSSNFIAVTIANYTGAATSTFAQATTTVEYRVIHQ